mmetsp:Transcript_123609/g.395413  ORF Transcript_123609/g.395413 Transcript_123609/m.395413 type:complete len:208 (+) Transcript_123609:960-1583(+)
MSLRSGARNHMRNRARHHSTCCSPHSSIPRGRFLNSCLALSTWSRDMHTRTLRRYIEWRRLRKRKYPPQVVRVNAMPEFPHPMRRLALYFHRSTIIRCDMIRLKQMRWLEGWRGSCQGHSLPLSLTSKVLVSSRRLVHVQHPRSDQVEVNMTGLQILLQRTVCEQTQAILLWLLQPNIMPIGVFWEMIPSLQPNSRRRCLNRAVSLR